MKFLTGAALTAAIKRLAKAPGEMKIAVAYWGEHGLKLTGINPKRSGLKVVCCLKGGKSDPDLIKKFGKRAKQNDQLHAKIIWTPEVAIVSSANASSNGMPEEENSLSGLIEAGVRVSDPEEVLEIGRWVDRLYQKSKVIKPRDLEDARIAREKRKWDGSQSRKKKQSLLDALSEGGRLEFEQQRVYFAFYKVAPTSKEDATAKASIRANKKVISDTYKISDSQFRGLDWYYDWPGIPQDAFLITCHYANGRCKDFKINKTFTSNKTWKAVDGSGEVQRLTLALPAGSRFPYKITTRDKRVIRESAGKLWKFGKPKLPDARIVSIKDAAQTLLKAI
jgi:hypothetical protein